MKKITFLIALSLLSLTSIAQNHSMLFDGSDDYINVDNNFAFEHTDSFTVEAWIKIDEAGLKQIISKLGTEAGTYRGWGFQINAAGYISGYVVTEWSVHTRYVRGTTLLFDNMWHHVAMTFDGADTITLYLDGALEPNGYENYVGTLTDIQTTAETHIGNFHGNGNQAEYFKGSIDDLRVWTGVRSASEIQANYLTELSGTEVNLIGYYKFDDDSSDCDIIDCSITQAHGTRNGVGGVNNLPQFSADAPSVTDVTCGATIMCELGINDNENLTEILLLPNPTAGPISLGGEDLNGSSVQIYSVLGKLVDEQMIQAQAIDISALPSGIYFLQFEINNQRIVKKIIKR